MPAIHALHGSCLTLVILLLASTYSNAQYPAPHPNFEDSSRIDIRGTVINSVTGEPVPHALVTLGGREVHSMLTESDGGFAFEKVPAENIFLQARRPGFFDRAATIVQPDKAKNVVVKLTPAGLIFGQVVDEDGEPIEGAPVRVLQEQAIVGKKKWMSANGAQTNDQGRYRIPNLRPGKYIIAFGPPWDTSRDGANTGYAPLFYPKAPDVGSATPISLSAGEQTEADFEVSRVPVFRVSGIVTGAKVQALRVSLTDGLANELAFGRSDSRTGEFEIRGAPKGTYRLRAEGFLGQGQGEERLTAEMTVTVNRDLSEVILLLHPPIVIPVQVRGGDSSQPGAPNTINRPPAIDIQPIPVSDNETGGYANLDGWPEGGQYKLHLPSPGAYNLVITSFGNGYVQSATSGNTDLLEDPLVVPVSGSIDPIEVVLASDGAKVRGVVRDAIPGALVVAVPENERRQPAITGFGPEGQFSFESLAPGEYSFYAVPPGSDYRDREIFKPLRSKAVHVTLSRNQTAEVTLDQVEAEP